MGILIYEYVSKITFFIDVFATLLGRKLFSFTKNFDYEKVEFFRAASRSFVNLFAALIMLCAIAYSCRKSGIEEKPPAFAEKPFAVIDENETKGKFHEFLQSVKKEGAQLRSFQDVEVNEGRWLLEATGNYLWNDNLDQIPTTKVVELQVEVTNTMSGSTINMVGTSMTSVFSAITTNAQNQIADTTEHLAALDIEIVGATETKTVLMTRVAITNSRLLNLCNELNHETWVFRAMSDFAASQISSCANLILPVYGVPEGGFFPDAEIWKNTDGQQCRTISPIVCLFGWEFPTFTAGPTEYEWFHDNQAPTAVQIMDEIEGQKFGVPDPDPAPIKASINVGFYYMEEPTYEYHYAVNNAVWKIGPVYYW